MRILMVDWENLVKGLGAWGVVWSPQRTLQALVAAIEGDLGRIDTVELHCPAHVESRSDRHVLRSGLGNVAVMFQVCWQGKNMADVQVAVAAAEALHSGHEVAIVSDDNDLGYVVKFHVQKHRASGLDASGAARRATLVHLRAEPPAIVKTVQGCSIPLPPTFRPRTRKRRLTSWDRVALSLHALASPSAPLATAAGLIEPLSPRWWEDKARGELGKSASNVSAHMEQLDSVVARLWRHRWGGDVDRSEATGAAATRLVDGVDPEPAIDALLAARLLRLTAGDLVEVAPSWRDGLLVPLRRVVLFLALRDDGRATDIEIKNLHRRSVAKALVTDDSDEARHVTAVHHAAVDDLHQYVVFALTTRIKALKVRPRQGGSTLALTDRSHPFVRDALDVAANIARRADPTVARQALGEHLAELGLVDPDRWVRCLLDAGVIRRAGDGYLAAPGAIARLPPQPR